MSEQAPILGYALPIGGGWAVICPTCFDTAPEEDDKASCEPIRDALNLKPDTCCEVCAGEYRDGEWQEPAEVSA